MSRNIQSLIQNIVIKKQPSDFYVDEIAFPSKVEEGEYQLYCLYKCGYTTSQALGLIAEDLGCSTYDLSYSGLKDEDGITRQNIAYHKVIDTNALQAINKKYASNSDQFIHLEPIGVQDSPLHIGYLLGNKFRIIARAVDESIAHKCAAIKEHQSYYINYYGVQRFGLPNRKKTSHKIGEHLLAQDYTQALQLIIEQDGYMSAKAFEYQNDPKAFFDTIDQRQAAFFYSSYYSYLWNQQIIDNIKENKLDSDCFDYDGVPHYFVQEQQARLNLLSKMPELALRKYRVKDEKVIAVESSRRVFIQTDIKILSVTPDESGPGTHNVELSFTLPSGVYATVILPQFFHEIASL